MFVKILECKICKSLWFENATSHKLQSLRVNKQTGDDWKDWNDGDYELKDLNKLCGAVLYILNSFLS